MNNWLASLRRVGLGAQSAVLLGAVLPVYAVVAPVACRLYGADGLAAAGLAAGLCLLGAELALVVCRLFRDPKDALYAVVFGMLLRMGIPLLAALVFCVRGGPLAEAGLLVYLVVFYPVTLSVETVLSVPPGGRDCRNGASRHPVS